jgi:class 3 adenylate cyclase
LNVANKLRAAFDAHDWPGGRRVAVSIALNTGEVIATAHGYFGVAVNVAFTMLKKARAADAGIVVSTATKGLLGDGDGFRALAGEPDVFEVLG